MTEKYDQLDLARKTVSLSDRIHFRMMSLVHEDLYRLFKDPYKVLDAAGLERGQQVLEVGCGPGFFTIPAARIVGPQGCIYSLDINPLAVEKVRRKVEASGTTNIKTVLADAADTGLPDESFDLIYVFGFGNPIGDMESILAELHRLLKPEGILSIEGYRGGPSITSKHFVPLRRQGRISQFKKAG